MHLLGFSLFTEAWLFDLAVYAHCILGLYIIIWETKRSEWWCVGVLSITTLWLAVVTYLSATQEKTDFYQLTYHTVHLGIGMVALFFGLARPAKETTLAPQHVTSEFEQQALAKKENENAPLPNFVEESASPEMMAASPSAVKATGAAAPDVAPVPAESPFVAPTPVVIPAQPVPVTPVVAVEPVPTAPRPAGAPPPVPGKPRPQPVAAPQPEPVAEYSEPEYEEPAPEQDADNAQLDSEPYQPQSPPTAYTPPPSTMNQGVPRKAEPRNPDSPRTRGPLPAGMSPLDSSLSRYATTELPAYPGDAPGVPRKAEPRKPGQPGTGPAGLGRPALPGASGKTGPLPRMTSQPRPPAGTESIIETPNTLASTQPFKILPHAPPPQEVYTPQVRSQRDPSVTGSLKPQSPSVPPQQPPKRIEGSRTPATPVRNPSMSQLPGMVQAQNTPQIQSRPPQQQPPARPAQPSANSTALQPINRTLATTGQSPAANSAASAFVSALKDRIAPFLEENVQPELISPGREDELRHRVEELVDLKFAQDGVNPGPRLRAMLLQDLYRDIPLLSDSSDEG
ncbi:MAG: hypothetical protein ACAI35_17230 [Candidatus Methylacidiphilales bacterium]|nr:hypothetical protein [Candidatus Methylacidiphilales bacterium]